MAVVVSGRDVVAFLREVLQNQQPVDTISRIIIGPGYIEVYHYVRDKGNRVVVESGYPKERMVQYMIDWSDVDRGADGY